MDITRRQFIKSAAAQSAVTPGRGGQLCAQLGGGQHYPRHPGSGNICGLDAAQTGTDN